MSYAYELWREIIEAVSCPAAPSQVEQRLLPATSLMDHGYGVHLAFWFDDPDD
jgi:hypothetical protein